MEMEQLVHHTTNHATVHHSGTVGELSPPIGSNWAKQNPTKYISTLRELKSKYDLVWQIEMGGGEQRFICYNAGDDPEALARKFVMVEHLSQHYEKILYFIRTQLERAKVDPNLSHIFLPNRKKAPISKYFPYMGDPLSYSTAKYPQIIKKISEFNEILNSDYKTVTVALSNNEMEILNDMVTKLEQCAALDTCHYVILDKLIEWPADKVFPALDLVRMVMDNPICIKYFQLNPIFILKLLNLVKKEGVSPTNMFLVLKSIVNIQRRDAERFLIKLFYNEMMSIFEIASFMDNTNVHNCLSSAMLNFTLLTTDVIDSKQRWIPILLRVIQNTGDIDSLRRCLLALGSLLHKERQLCKTIYLLPEYKAIEKLSNSPYEEKIRECAQDIATLVFLLK